MEKIENEKCPFCKKRTLTLAEDEQDIPYFGKVYIFSMACSNCNYKKADVESADRKEPCKITFEINNAKDMQVRVVKSSEATIKFPQLKMSVTPGTGSEGYVSNVEGVIYRFKKVIEDERDAADDDETRDNAKKLLKRLWKVELGEMPLKMIIEDPSGNSAVISEKATMTKL
ncbi:ZPR1 zinc finger domain-containing protein [Candidatus Woesearchaeota archaeon]|nr:ZPR1 zinc finger domain-containing protein [Candidatus Woesearchaeota archaeon]